MTGRGLRAACAVTLFAAACGLFASPRVAGASIVAVRVEADRTTVLRDAPFAVTVSVENSGFSGATIEAPEVSGCTIERAGTSQNLVMAAGNVVRTDVVVYRVTASLPGTLVLPPFRVSVGKERRETSSLRIEVVASLPAAPIPGGGAATRGAPLFARFAADRRHAFWNEQIVARMEIYSRSPLEDMPSWEAPSAPGFWSEPLGDAVHDRVTVGGDVYERYVRRLAFFPTRTGTLTLGPARAIVRVAREDAAAFEPLPGMLLAPPTLARIVDVPIEAAPLTVTVAPLPAGAPASFAGAVGDLSLSVQVDRKSARAGEPITVSTTIRGEGNLASARDPELVAVPAYPSYPSAARTEWIRTGPRLRGARRMEISFVPDRPGSLVVLPIGFSWFDPELGIYRTQRSDSVVVHVTPAPAGAGRGAEVVRSATAIPAPPRHAAGRSGRLDGAPQGATLLFGGVSLAAYAVLGAATARRRKAARDPRRRRAALAAAVTADLERGVEAGAAGANERAAAGLRELAGLRFGVDVEGRSDRELVAWLERSGAAPAELEALRGVLASLEADAYAPRDSGVGASGGAPSAALRGALALARRWRDECSS